ncbi:MAG: hypothetical protein ACK44O_00215 [Novosphingobium sp.]|jgi:tetrahydromethanopterin S-methyltransferase subunit A|uniref:hypothetical protein n=1 Tax=Novosphingobium sp. TaxID=1874826 RepID=UPI00391D8430|nr:hypothetical protein [Novosphingobium sp.]
MEFGEFMGLAVAMGSIVGVISIITKTYLRRLEHKERIAEIGAQGAKPGSPDRSDVIERLEHRIRVLERIATDKSENVAAQIEALRDERVALTAPTKETV